MEMWTSKVKVWDEYKKEHFYLKALLFVTISDLPGLGCLSGQVTKGYKGCVVCLDGTYNIQSLCATQRCELLKKCNE